MNRPRLALLGLALVSAFTLVAAAQAPRADGPQGRMAQADRNGDQRLDRAEAAALPRLAERFDRIDRNRDQQLDRAELRKAFRLAESRRELNKARREAMRARFIFLDSNGDEALTLAELGGDAPKLTEHFTQIDANRDGRLVPEEMRAHARAQREARHARG